MNTSAIQQDLAKLSNAKRAVLSQRFFKCGKGEYGEGDRFIGISTPDLRLLAKKHREVSLQVIETLLRDPVHERRLLALFLLVGRFRKADNTERSSIVDLYLRNTLWINNWDLVDSSAYHILGSFLLHHDRTLLDRLATKDHLWTQRIAIVSTYAFIRKGECKDTFRIADLLLHHPHDLIHKAVGWMLREVGKRDMRMLCTFLQSCYKTMPRTMLRYAIEKFPESERQQYLTGKI